MMHSKFITILIFISLLVFTATSAIAASLISTVDRNQISLNETLLLTLTLDQQADNSALNLDTLEENFEVLGVSPLNSSSFTLVNGKTTQEVTTQWSIRLLPKRVGAIKIPTFTIAGASSQPITISVKSSVLGETDDSPLKVSVVASSAEVYPKQQLILTIELSAQADVKRFDGSPLKIDNAEIHDLGQTSRELIDNGVARQLIQLKYAIFAKQTGTIEIPALSFSGRQGGSRSLFGNRGKRVVARSNALAITVKESPESKHIWLPSQNIEIASELSGEPSQYQVGTPITRKIIIKAQGLKAEAIPPISNNIIESDTAGGSAAKSYADKPQLHTAISEQGLLGTRIESMAIVPSVAGELKLPELRLNFWNVITQKWQQAILPAESILIAGSADTQKNADEQNNESQTKQLPINNATESTDNNVLWKVISALLLLVCIAQFIVLKLKPIIDNRDQVKTWYDQSESKAWKQLQTLLKQGDAGEIRQGILNWARVNTEGDDNINLSSMIRTTNSNELRLALTSLEAHLYGNEKRSLSENDINLIRQALESFRQKTKQKEIVANTKESALKPLYPS